MAEATITAEQRNRIEEILRLLEQSPTPREVVNRRRAVRVRIHAALTCHLLTLPGHPTLPVHTRNISTNGVAFVSRRPFKKGEFLAIELYLVPHLAKLVLAETTFSRYVRDGLYEVGCRFREAVSRESVAAKYSRLGVPAEWIEMALPSGPGVRH